MKIYANALAAIIVSGILLVAAPRLAWPATGAGSAAAATGMAHADTLSGPYSGSVHVGLPDILERELGVNDPVFSILTRLITSGTYGTLTQERLQQEVARIGGQSRLPYESIISITREQVKPGWTALIRLEFKKPIDLPIPYSILGYHPGSFTTTQRCVFREWEIGNIRLSEVAQKGDHSEIQTIDLEDVHLFASVEGEVKIDIDAWVDALFGGAIDDTDITAIMLGRWQGEWYGVAMGYSHDKNGRSGIFSLRQDKILFPSPEGLRMVSRQMRTRAERLGRVWDAGGARIDGVPDRRLLEP